MPGNRTSLIYNQPNGRAKVARFARPIVFFVVRLSMTADPIPDPIPDPPRSPRRKIWRAALFLAGSAVFSGVALALWNRRELTRIQQSTPPAAPPPAHIPDDEIY